MLKTITDLTKNNNDNKLAKNSNKPNETKVIRTLTHRFAKPLNSLTINVNNKCHGQYGVKLNSSTCSQPTSYISTMVFNQLPFDIVCLIFKHFPLQTIFSFRAVCHTWLEFVENICSNKLRLTLNLFTNLNGTRTAERTWPRSHRSYYFADQAIDDNGAIDNNFNVLHFPAHLVGRLIPIFRGLTQLYIRLDEHQREARSVRLFNGPIIPTLGSFISEVNPTGLEHLSFRIEKQPNCNARLLPELCSQIDWKRLIALRSLHLYTGNVVNIIIIIKCYYLCSVLSLYLFRLIFIK